MYSEDMHNLILDYANQFWEAYPENRKFFRTHISDAHEHFGELVKYLDEDLHRFLENFQKKGHMNDTLIAFIGDHGSHNYVRHFKIFPDDSRNQENVMPNFLHLVPKSIPKENLEFLRYNEQSLMNNYDFYSTMKTISEGVLSKSEYVESFPYIAEKLPVDRDCTNKEVFLARCWCYMDPKIAQQEHDKIQLFRSDTVLHY